MMDLYPFLVLVPHMLADETTMGEWLESNEADYVSASPQKPFSTCYEFHFSSKKTADAFARNFIG